MIALITITVILVLKMSYVAGVSLRTSAALNLTVSIAISLDTGYRKTTTALTLKLQWTAYLQTLLQYTKICNDCILLPYV